MNLSTSTHNSPTIDSIEPLPNIEENTNSSNIYQEVNEANIDNSCTELKNIKYKMRLMNPLNSVDMKTNNNSYANLQLFLDDEKNKTFLELYEPLKNAFFNA
jgi:hypothetical protein